MVLAENQVSLRGTLAGWGERVSHDSMVARVSNVETVTRPTYRWEPCHTSGRIQTIFRSTLVRISSLGVALTVDPVSRHAVRPGKVVLQNAVVAGVTDE